MAAKVVKVMKVALLAAKAARVAEATKAWSVGEKAAAEVAEMETAASQAAKVDSAGYSELPPRNLDTPTASFPDRALQRCQPQMGQCDLFREEAGA